MKPVKSSARLTLRDRLSRLTPAQAAKWLGPEGPKLLRKPQTLEIEFENILLEDHLFQLTLPLPAGAPVVITLSSDPQGYDGVLCTCSEAKSPTRWIAGTLAFILQEKTALGLAEPPGEPPPPAETLDAAELETRALAERVQRAREEKMRVSRLTKEKGPWTDYLVRSAQSGKAYRVALRGPERGQSFCTCGDFRKNTLGTCKHVLRTLAWVRKHLPAAALARRFRPAQLAVHVRYAGEPRLALEIPPRLPPPLAALAEAWRDREARTTQETVDLLAVVCQIEAEGEKVLIFPDAEEWIARALHAQRLARLVKEIRRQPATHPLRTTLLQTELLPYQLDGIAFAAGAGRAILADELGLGKTLQGIGVAELLASHAEVTRVLIICPASLKAHWAADRQILRAHRAAGLRGTRRARGAIPERGLLHGLQL